MTKTTTTTEPPRHYVVMSLSPRERFCRAGIHFTRDWRPIVVGDATNITADIPVVSLQDLARLQAEAVTTQLEYAEVLAGVEPDPERRASILAAARRIQKGDPTYFRRPMLAIKPASEQELATWSREQSLASLTPEAQLAHERAKNADLQAKHADLEARLMRLELGSKTGGKATP